MHFQGQRGNSAISFGLREEENCLLYILDFCFCPWPIPHPLGFSRCIKSSHGAVVFLHYLKVLILVLKTGAHSAQFLYWTISKAKTFQFPTSEAMKLKTRNLLTFPNWYYSMTRIKCIRQILANLHSPFLHTHTQKLTIFNLWLWHAFVLVLYNHIFKVFIIQGTWRLCI